MMRPTIIVLALAVSGSPLLARQAATCRTALASLSVPESGYAVVDAAPFGGRLYVYAPAIQSSYVRGSFTAFQLWIVEGVYGRPMARATGTLDAAGFDRLRRSANVRTTAVNVSRPMSAPFTFGRQSYILEIVRVNVPLSGGESVDVRVCR